MARRDLYEVLGVAKGASDDEIKKAYRKIAFESHPDRNPGDKAAEQRFKEATEAYEVLRDEQKRARYDRFGHAATEGAPAPGDFSGFDLADALRAFMRDFGGEGGFEDLFGARGGAAGPRRGDDLQVRLKLGLEEIASGVEKKIRVKHLHVCATCGGRGGKGEAICRQCDGRGQVRHVQQSFFGQFVNIATCPRCHGEGRTLREPCRDCEGEGRVSQSETISVKVPAGVSTGNFIPLRGMGDAGPHGGPAGDLIVLIEEKPHPVFDRAGDDLRVDVPISFATAALGGRIEVPTLDGAAAAVEVAAGTQTGKIARVRGKGLPGLRGGHGDLLARLIVWVPSKLSGAERKQLEELGRGEGLKPPRPGKSLFERVKDSLAG
ncbi:MAG: molecular chaperone DnaJ [Candidatus Eisenbacteria bacterium]|uniref:Chaperone protein DnaJ n=1 Tax=Eiseniibacteriota bacterium TaxID=2212470 RepID=A0A538U4T1_UNCEI|nr:MAG: molecular chaperone DnaJ [Candidatus Eisenbacteria bacterium]